MILKIQVKWFIFQDALHNLLKLHSSVIETVWSKYKVSPVRQLPHHPHPLSGIVGGDSDQVSTFFGKAR